MPSTPIDRFGLLPGELQMQIYSYIFRADDGLPINFRVRTLSKANRCIYWVGTAQLTRVPGCRAPGNAWPEHMKQALLQAIQFVNLLDLKQGFYSCISFMIYELTGEWRDGDQIASVIASRQHQPHDQSSASRHGFTVTPLPRNALSLTLINHAYRDKVLVMLMSKFVFDFACFDALNKFNKSVTPGWRDYIVLVRLQHIEGQSSYPFESMKSLLLNAIPNLRVVQLSLQPRDPRRASFDDWT